MLAYFLLTAALGLNATLKRTDVVDSTSFLDFFYFYDSADPTHGFVDYVSQGEALGSEFVKFDNNQIYIGSDRTSDLNPYGRGRKSVRVHSRKKYTTGLFILDVEHMPSGCGTWPAFWTVGPGWPNGGEIDIIEGVNNDVQDTSTLHTSANCKMSSVDTNSFTGQWSKNKYGGPATDCNVRSSSQWGNQGCGIQNNINHGSYGEPFNLYKGGVIVMFWQKSGIQFWFWQRDSIPADIKARNPNPSSWGLPYAKFDFGRECSSNHFYDHKIIFNTDFCGDWAGGTFASQCSSIHQSCNAFVANHQNVQEAYWLVNYLDVYSVGSDPTPTPTPGKCTSQDQDPWASGSFVDCCSGLKSCLKKWDNWRDPYYRCEPTSDSSCMNLDFSAEAISNRGAL